MFNLSRFGLREMMECRSLIRALFEDEPSTLGEASDRIVRFLYENLVDDEGRSACALVRTFKTHPYSDLDPDLKDFARRIVDSADTIDGLRCLVLLSTAGDQPQWNSRHESQGHKAIPLLSERVVEEAPMISQLIKQFGVRLSTVLRPDPSLLLDTTQTAYNVFYVPEALGSPYIVAQKEFVEPYRIKSVVGFGGMTVTGDLFATILFSKVAISPQVAEQFKVIGLNFRLALVPLARKPLFAPGK